MSRFGIRRRLGGLLRGDDPAPDEAPSLTVELADGRSQTLKVTRHETVLVSSRGMVEPGCADQRCGACAVELISGALGPCSAQEAALIEADPHAILEPGWRLGCYAQVVEDVHVRAPYLWSMDVVIGDSG